MKVEIYYTHITLGGGGMAHDPGSPCTEAPDLPGGRESLAKYGRNPSVWCVQEETLVRQGKQMQDWASLYGLCRLESRDCP